MLLFSILLQACVLSDLQQWMFALPSQLLYYFHRRCEMVQCNTNGSQENGCIFTSCTLQSLLVLSAKFAKLHGQLMKLCNIVT